MNRILEKESSDDEEVIYPIMCMSSVEPVQIKQGILNTFFDFNDLSNQLFMLTFSAFKRKEEEESTILNYIVTSMTAPVLPELISVCVSDIASQEAKDFLLDPLQNFKPFKKAILLFDKRPYLLNEFETMIVKWKESLKELLK